MILVLLMLLGGKNFQHLADFHKEVGLTCFFEKNKICTWKFIVLCLGSYLSWHISDIAPLRKEGVSMIL